MLNFWLTHANENEDGASTVENLIKKSYLLLKYFNSFTIEAL